MEGIQFLVNMAECEKKYLPEWVVKMARETGIQAADVVVDLLTSTNFTMKASFLERLLENGEERGVDFSNMFM